MFEEPWVEDVACDRPEVDDAGVVHSSSCTLLEVERAELTIWRAI